MLSRKRILKYISIVVLVKIVGFGIFFMYSVESSLEKKESKTLKINPIETIGIPQKEKISQAEQTKQKNAQMQWILEDKMKTVYSAIEETYDKTKKKKENLQAIKKRLDSFSDTDIFVANFYEKTLYGSNNYEDIHARTVVLEEIQKVRRRGEGFIVSTINEKGKKRYVFVKKLNFLDLYVGINLFD